MEQDSDMALTHKELADSSNQWRIQGYLRPLTSHGTRRYDTIKFVTKSSMEIPPGLFSKPQPEPAYCLENGWTAHTHPEGNLYFSRSGDLNVVTSAFLYDPWTLQTATAWIQRIHTMLLESQVVLTADMELFIELEDNDCGYYLVDHSNRTQFWLEPCNTETLELPEVASMLQLSAGAFFWHSAPPCRRKIANHSADQMTSSVSTFGYSAKECGSFLNVLQVCRSNNSCALQAERLIDLASDTLDSKETTCVIARLWGTVYHQRIWNHYGEEQARLSRDQRILYHAGDSEASRSSRCFFVLANALTLGNFRTHAARLDDVFADDLVNSVQWPIFVLRNLEDWKREGAVTALPLPVPEAAILPVTGDVRLSTRLVSDDLRQFLYQIQEHGTILRRSGPCAHQTNQRDYLCAIELGSFRFALVALVFALPKALCVWGASTLLVNYMLLIARLFGAKIALLLSGGLLFYCIIVYIVITGGAYSGVVRLVQGSPQYETEIV
ncbi:hypothetical protein C8F01DRAFT_1080929 [Mycena amicta]|nr:hypothetical protein C8F01DRAFT_1080929 [Mycena amicta]